MVELVDERPSTANRARLMPMNGWDADLVARSGYAFHVRPAAPSDEAGLAEFFTHVGKDDLRFRFLTAVRTVGHDQLQALVTVDHHRTENFLAIDPETRLIVATAMLAADEAMTDAEVAVAIRADYKRHGISWTLLDHVSHFAAAQGIKTLKSIESRDNVEAIKLERERGWVAAPYPDDPSVMELHLTLNPAISETLRIPR